MQPMTTLAASWVAPTHTGKEALALILRWFHFIAGITWVGLLYFFNLVNVPFMKQVDAAMKPKVFQYMTLPALNWFRWSSLVTVFVGFWYWGEIYVGADAKLMGVSPFEHDWPVPAHLDCWLGNPLCRYQASAHRIRSRRHRRRGCHCWRMAVRELHTSGSGR